MVIGVDRPVNQKCGRYESPIANLQWAIRKKEIVDVIRSFSPKGATLKQIRGIMESGQTQFRDPVRPLAELVKNGDVIRDKTVIGKTRVYLYKVVDKVVEID